jgi:hypothetical protein
VYYVNVILNVYFLCVYDCWQMVFPFPGMRSILFAVLLLSYLPSFTSKSGHIKFILRL